MTEFSFVWGVKRSFLHYLSSVPGTQASVAGGAASTKDGRFVFPAAEDIQDIHAMSGCMKFEGEVRFISHGGMLDVVLADPWIEVDRSTASLSFATVGSDGSDKLRIVVGELLEKRANTDGARAWETKLVESGVPIFGDTYVVGEVLDPVYVLPAR